MHKENPKNKEPIRCLAPFEDLEDFNNENNLAQTESRARRIICIEIDDQGIVRKFSEEGEKDQTEEGLEFPINTEAIFFNAMHNPKQLAIIGKLMSKIPELEKEE